MIVLKANDARAISDKKKPFELEKEKVMNDIHIAANRGDYSIQIYKNGLKDYRLMVAWLVDLGYHCVANEGSDRIYVRWQE